MKKHTCQRFNKICQCSLCQEAYDYYNYWLKEGVQLNESPTHKEVIDLYLKAE